VVSFLNDKPGTLLYRGVHIIAPPDMKAVTWCTRI